MAQSSVLDAEVVSIDDRYYFEYEATDDDEVLYHYASFAIKTDDSFYLVQFGCEADQYDEDMFANFVEWFDSISIGESSNNPGNQGGTKF